MSSFEKAEYNDYFSGKPQMIIAKGEPLANIEDIKMWKEYGKPVLWFHMQTYIHYGTHEDSSFAIYYDVGYSSWMIIVNDEFVYQATTTCECFEYGNYCITFQEDSDHTNFYTKINA